MGKYERSLKQLQLKNLVADNDFDKALEIVDGMSDDKSADASDLKLYAEIYNKCGIYDKARDLYRRVYKEIPTRRVLYRLIVMCAKSGSIQEAEELLEQYIEKDSEGVNRYILRYKIDKEAGDSTEVLVRDLEMIAETEYSEKWAYELIKLYYKAGMDDACIAECRNMIMWFSEGELVNKARKLLNNYYKVEEKPEEPSVDEPETVSKETEVSEIIPEEPVLEEIKPEEPVLEEIKPEEEVSEDDISEEEPIAKVEIPEDDIIKIDIFGEEEKPASQENEFSFSKFADDIPYIHDKLFFSSIENININRLSFVVAAEDTKAADRTVQKIAKIVRKVRGRDLRIAKIGAEKLNSIDFEKELAKLNDACILVDNASEMSSKSINSVIKVIEVYPDSVAIILMDTEEALSRMFFREQILKNQISHYIYVN